MHNHTESYQFTNPETARSIELKLSRLQGQNDFFFINRLLSNHFLNCLDHEANLHSYNLSHPEGSNNSYTTHGKGRERKKGLKLLEKGYVWAKENFDSLKISVNYLRKIALLIEPSLPSEEDLANLRARSNLGEGLVRHTGASWTPPYPDKISSEFTRFVSEIFSMLCEDTICSTLDAAAYAHLHIVRIHPFEDGNSRLARIVQNTILKSKGIPLPIIYSGESSDYTNHIGRAIAAWRARTGETPKNLYDTKAEGDFYNFIAGKVLIGLDRLLSRT